jgi:putative acetyltransferase
MQLTLRDATKQDEIAIRAIVESVLREYGLQADPNQADADLADLRASYIERGGVFRVLLDERGTIVGCGGLYPLEGGEAEIRKMYFLPNARGRGYGRRLLAELIEAARARGCRRVVLETASVLKEAIALYHSFGFAPYQREHLACRCDQAMVLDIDPGATQKIIRAPSPN